MNLGDFFGELRRRNIFKVTAAYAVVSWLIIQVATVAFPYLEIPPWCVRLVIVLLALGFPAAMILAWACELTPQGIKCAEEVPAEVSVKHQTGQRLNTLIIVVLGCAIAVLLFQRFHPGETPASIPEKSIDTCPPISST